jgi:ribosomal-protein-alanine N-acetyltransferase
MSGHASATPSCRRSNSIRCSPFRGSGFRDEGYAKEYLCIDGRWQDHVLFAMLGDEWAGVGR